jgi:two-component system CheB/CheR fusion protein
LPVNGELNQPTSEPATASSDLKGPPDSSRIATVFLDRDLRIMKVTAAALVLGFSDSDLGRPIDEIESGLVYAGLRADASEVLRTLGRFERQLQDAKTGSRYLLRMVPYRTIENSVAGVVLTFLGVTAAVHGEERFHMMAATVPAALFTADANLAWDYVNPPFYAWTGLADGAALGEGWMVAVHADDVGDVRQRLAECRQSRRVFEHEFRLRDASRGYRWYLARATAIRSSAGEVTSWAGSLIDIHERRTAEARQRLLFAELQHRVKNVLGVVRSIVSQTVETSASLDEFARHFDGRLSALARTQTSLARHGNLGVELEELIAEELLSHAPADDGQITMSGPSIRIGDRAAEALGLAVHELATNAVKYGAFANPQGRVSVAWTLRQVGGERRLRLEWREDTVAVIDPDPKRVGFGREFLERGLPFELGADTALEFRPGGLRFVLDAPLGSVWSKDLDGRRAP